MYFSCSLVTRYQSDGIFAYLGTNIYKVSAYETWVYSLKSNSKVLDTSWNAQQSHISVIMSFEGFQLCGKLISQPFNNFQESWEDIYASMRPNFYKAVAARKKKNNLKPVFKNTLLDIVMTLLTILNMIINIINKTSTVTQLTFAY